MTQYFDTPLVYTLDASGTTTTANGQTAALDTLGNTRVTWVADLTTLSGGSTPDVTFTWQHSPDNTNWYDIASESALSAVGTKVRVTAEHTFRWVRVKWVTTGSPTGAEADIYVQARQR